MTTASARTARRSPACTAQPPAPTVIACAPARQPDRSPSSAAIRSATVADPSATRRFSHSLVRVEAAARSARRSCAAARAGDVRSIEPRPGSSCASSSARSTPGVAPTRRSHSPTPSIGPGGARPGVTRGPPGRRSRRAPRERVPRPRRTLRGRPGVNQRRPVARRRRRRAALTVSLARLRDVDAARASGRAPPPAPR